MSHRDEHEHDEFAHSWVLSKAEGDGAFVEAMQHLFLDEDELVIGVVLNAAEVWSEDFLFDLLNFEADLLAAGREEQEALQGVPIEQRVGVPLLVLAAERVHKTSKHETPVNFNLVRALDLRDFVKQSDRNLPKDFVDLLEGF